MTSILYGYTTDQIIALGTGGVAALSTDDMQALNTDQ